MDLYIRNETKDLNIEYEDSHEGRHDVLETWTFVAMRKLTFLTFFLTFKYVSKYLEER